MSKADEATLAQYMKRHYPVRLTWSDEDSCWYVRYPDLPGCVSDGATEIEALQNGEEAKSLWFEAAMEIGQPIPEPSVDNTEFNGRILFRTSKENHRWLAERAELQNISMNQLLGNLLSRARGETETVQAVNELLKEPLTAIRNLQAAQSQPSAKLSFPSGTMPLGGIAKFEVSAAALMSLSLEQSNVLTPIGIAKMRQV